MASSSLPSPLSISFMLTISFIPLLNTLGLPSSAIPTGHTPPPGSGGPIRPGGCGYNELPAAVLENCTDPLADGIPDLRGYWEGTISDSSLLLIGSPITASMASNKPHWERIEQCGDRIVWTSGCVVHDFRHADGNTSNGCHDYSAVACIPLRVAGVFNASCSILKPFGIVAAVKRCLQPDGSMRFDWGTKTAVLRRTNRSTGFEACDQ